MWSWYLLVFGPTSILSVLTYKVLTYIQNHHSYDWDFCQSLKILKLMYAPSSGSKTDFVWLITKQFFVWHSNTFELENLCK